MWSFGLHFAVANHLKSCVGDMLWGFFSSSSFFGLNLMLWAIHSSLSCLLLHWQYLHPQQKKITGYFACFCCWRLAIPSSYSTKIRKGQGNQHLQVGRRHLSEALARAVILIGTSPDCSEIAITDCDWESPSASTRSKSTKNEPPCLLKQAVAYNQVNVRLKGCMQIKICFCHLMQLTGRDSPDKPLPSCL